MNSGRFTPCGFSVVAFWDALKPLTDWEAKTLTICTDSAALMADVPRALLGRLEPDQLRWFRFEIELVEPNVGVMQRTKIERRMVARVPGFSEPTLARISDHRVAVAQLLAPAELDSQYLDSYPATDLVGIGGPEHATEDLCHLLCAVNYPVDQRGYGELRGIFGDVALARFLDRETHYILQMVGSCPQIARFQNAVESLKIERLVDVRDVGERIYSWG